MPNPSHISAEKRNLVKEYLHTPQSERLPLAVFRKEYKINRSKFVELKMDIEREDKELAMINLRNVQENLLEGLDGDVPDSAQAWIEDNWLDLVKGMHEAAIKRGNAQAATFLGKISGKLVDKVDIKIGLTAEEVTRRNLEAEKELKKGGYLLGSPD